MFPTGVGISEIDGQIGKDIPPMLLKSQLCKMIESGEIGRQGKLRHSRYL